MKTSLIKLIGIIGVTIVSILALITTSFATLSYQETYSSTAGTKTVLIMVNSAIYDAIYDPSLIQYIADLEAEGYSVVLTKYFAGSPEEIRSYIRNIYGQEGLCGVVLVGDIPTARSLGIMGPGMPTDLFYMDLNGVWQDTDSDGSYDRLDGDINPEIWAGRLLASPVIRNDMDEAAMLRNYFRKNHAYRIGNLTVPQRALYYSLVNPPQDCHLADAGYNDIKVMVDWTTLTIEDYKQSLNAGGSLLGWIVELLAHSTYYVHCFNDGCLIGTGIPSQDPDVMFFVEKGCTTCRFTVDAYIQQLQEGYEWLSVCAHSSPQVHSLEGGFLWSNQIPAIDPKVLFYHDLGCSNCRFTESNYMGGQYLFSLNYGLLVMGITEPGGSSRDSYEKFYMGIGGSRKSIGEAFAQGLTWGSVVLLGDPTLTLDPPRAFIDSITPTTISQGQAVTFNGSGRINQGSITAYSWRSNKDGFLSNQNSFSFSFSSLSPGNHTIYFKVKDNNGRWSSEASTNLRIGVGSNHPPALDSIGNKTITEGSVLTFTVTATDPDEDILTYSATGLPSGATFDTPTHTFSWNPGYTQAGAYNLNFTVSDGSLDDSEAITISVTNTNQPPVFNRIGNKSVAEGVKLEFSITATDPDGDNLTYSATGLPSGAGFDASTRVFSWTPNIGQAENYPITFLVTDGYGGSVSETLTISVTIGVPAAPSNLTATAISPGEVVLQWTDNSIDETGFEVQWSKLREWLGIPWGKVVVGRNITTYTVELNAGTKYYLRICALKDNAHPAYSEIVTVTTHKIPPPSNLQAEVLSTSQVHLNWQDNADNESGFQIFYGPPKQVYFTRPKVVINTPNAIEYVLSGLQPATTYAIVVRPFYRHKSNSSITWESDVSNEVTITTLGIPQITAVNPQNSLGRSATIVINGENFGPQQRQSRVMLAGKALQVRSWSNTQIICLTPATRAQSAALPLEVITAWGETTTITLTFDIAPPQITEPISISGTNPKLPITFTATVKDIESGVKKVILCYAKHPRAMTMGIGRNYKEETMSASPGSDTYTFTIPANTLDSGKYDYYIYAQDKAGNGKGTRIYSFEIPPAIMTPKPRPNRP